MWRSFHCFSWDMRPFWHNMASWPETPHGFPMSFLSTATIIITTTTIILIIIMIIITLIRITIVFYQGYLYFIMNVFWNFHDTIQCKNKCVWGHPFMTSTTNDRTLDLLPNPHQPTKVNNRYIVKKKIESANTWQIS